jgi:hypothetical protein
MRTGRILLGLSATVLVAVLATGAPALAHNALTGSDPENGATVTEAPERVRLTFRASLDPLNTHLSVTGPDSEPVEAGEPAVDGTSVSIPLPAGPAGEYRVSYRVLSSDGDWVEGAIGFTVSVGTAPSPPPAAPDPSPEPRLSGSPVPAARPAAGDPGSPTGWWPWLLAGLGLAAIAGAAGYAGYRRLARATNGSD